MIEQLLSTLKDDPPGPPPGVEFLGEVPTSGFIDGEALASAIDLEAGIAQFSSEPWLHFILDDVELYIAKKPYRSHVSWNHINDVGAVFGTRRVEIDGREYKVRLLKSAASGDMYTGSRSAWDPVEAYDSEWNRLMYPIHSGNHTDDRNPPLVSGEGLHFGTLAQYTDTDLVLHSAAGNGRQSWCQETSSSSPTARVHRGSSGISYLYRNTASHATAHHGWRPVLELVQ